MKNSIIIQIFSVLIILISCQEKKEKQIIFDEKTRDSTVITSSIKQIPLLQNKEFLILKIGILTLKKT